MSQSSSTVPMLHLGDSLGVAFLAILFVAILFGVTNVQTYLYFSHSKGDLPLLRWAVFVLWLLDGLHFASFAYRLYFLLIWHFGDLSPLLPPMRGVVSVWSLLLWCITSTVSDFLVRIIFGFRAWRFSKGNKLLAVVFGFVTLFVLGIGLAFPIEVSKIYKFTTLPIYSWIILVYLGSIVVADSVIAGSLCVLLWKNRTGAKLTDSTLHVLMLYSINTGLLTSIFALTGLITYIAKPNTFIYTFFLSALPKLYFNALLANLNARRSIHNRHSMAVLCPHNVSRQPESMDIAFRRDSMRSANASAVNYPSQTTINVEFVAKSTNGSAANVAPPGAAMAREGLGSYETVRTDP